MSDSGSTLPPGAERSLPPGAETSLPTGARTSLRPLHHVALILPVLILALCTRWALSIETGLGPEFHPRPDALEYAASAQALADGGRFYLQVGPLQLRPRYAPGWPLLLSFALRLGVPAEELWRIPGICGAALAVLLAEVVALVTISQRRNAPFAASRAWQAVVAGLFAGSLWALLPPAAYYGSMLMSDEPALLLQAAALTSLALAFRDGKGRPVSLLVLAGFCVGLLATMRLIAALLLAAPLGILLLDWTLRCGARAGARAATWLVGAALPPILATIWILLSADLPAWPWDAYAFWAPDFYAELSTTFHPRYALEGMHLFTMPFGEQRGHWQHATFLLLGLPGLVSVHSAGVAWPALAWLYGGSKLLRASQRSIGVALAALVLGTVAVFVFYFFPDTRFYLAPLAIAAGLAGLALGDCLALRIRFASVLGLCIALASAGSVAYQLRDHWQRMWRPGRWMNEQTLAAAPGWFALDDTQRAEIQMPFDSVRAQALGILPYQRAQEIGEWGRMPDTEHVSRLQRFHGLLKEE